MEDLYAKFLPQFVTLARKRITSSITAATQRDEANTKTIVRELHTLAGEAGLLGLSKVVPLARECEQKARLVHTQVDFDALVAVLRELEHVIDGLEVTSPEKGGGGS
jgi:HPt (histidine-containing phosphotransfer) domain-containing protein